MSAMAQTSVTSVAEAAARLAEAACTRRVAALVRDLLGNSDIDAAYAVQRELTRRREQAGGVNPGAVLSSAARKT